MTILAHIIKVVPQGTIEAQRVCRLILIYNYQKGVKKIERKGMEKLFLVILSV
jgi:hypothetical protein